MLGWRVEEMKHWMVFISLSYDGNHKTLQVCLRHTHIHVKVKDAAPSSQVSSFE